MNVRYLLLATALIAPLGAHAQEGGAAPAADKPAAEAPAAEAPAAEAAPAEEAKPAEEKAAEEAKPAPAPAPPTTGSLSVSSQPAGAKIFIDDKDTGKTTPVVDIAVEPGTHTLKVVSGARTKSVTFHLEAGATLNLNLNLPEAEPVAKTADTPKADDAKADDTKIADADADGEPAAAAEPDWTWMTVTGWTGLGLGTMGIIAGAVVLTTPGDQDQGPLGFGLFGTGAGLILGGGVLLYLDNELADASANGEPAAETSAALPLVMPAVAAR
jgi:hypothetical protein